MNANVEKLPQAWRVEKVERVAEAGAPSYAVVLSAIYYGPDEDGPKVGDTLGPVKVK